MLPDVNSDVPLSYGVFVRFENPELKFPDTIRNSMLQEDNRIHLPKLHAERDRQIAWVMSNGYPKNRRTKIAQELSQYMQVLVGVLEIVVV